MEQLLGLPVLASEQGRQVDQLIIYIHWLMIALFVGWLGYFAFVLFRFHHKRHPQADYLGVRNHASSYIEGIVALVEVLLLAAVAVPFWARAVGHLPAENQATVLQVVAQQFAWNVRYPGPDGVFGKQDMRWVTAENVFGVDPADPHGKDDVQTLNEIHVPLLRNPDGQNRPVIVYISSKDVIHSFKVIALRVTQDAIPGLRIPVWFRPTQEGRYQINCAQLCGNGHSSMSQGMLVIESPEAYRHWLSAHAGGATSFE